jgi:hypothetical protein
MQRTGGQGIRLLINEVSVVDCDSNFPHSDVRLLFLCSVFCHLSSVFCRLSSVKVPDYWDIIFKKLRFYFKVALQVVYID